MSQATRRWISEKVKSLRESNVLPFHDILDVTMVKAALTEEGVTFNESISTPLVTTCVFLSQDLSYFFNGPDEELSFVALGIGILCGIKTTFRVGHFAGHIVQCLFRDAPR